MIIRKGVLGWIKTSNAWSMYNYKQLLWNSYLSRFLITDLKYPKYTKVFFLLALSRILCYSPKKHAEAAGSGTEHILFKFNRV